ncbi:MAG: hypothetical protein ACT4QD_10905 [Acidobacteriota bacterium]
MGASVNSRGPVFEAGDPAALFTPQLPSATAGPFLAQWDVAPDRRFVMASFTSDLSTMPITLVFDWKGK